MIRLVFPANIFPELFALVWPSTLDVMRADAIEFEMLYITTCVAGLFFYSYAYAGSFCYNHCLIESYYFHGNMHSMLKMRY